MAKSPTMEPPPTKLTYSIAGCSEHSGRYVAENILHDYPKDQSSRWSGTHQTPNVLQWILLKLDALSVLTSITFGKYHRQHPCNMKEFKLLVGTSPNSLKEVLHSGLKNDPIPETISVRYTNDGGVPFPVRFVKIIPLSAHGQTFHTSIWYVALGGITDEAYVEQVRKRYEEHIESVALSHVLSHLRRRRLLTPYQCILARTRHRLEHPLVSRLHSALVLDGDFALAEDLLKEMAEQGMFREYLRGRAMRAQWQRLSPLPRTRAANSDSSADASAEDSALSAPQAPCARGGHAMCIDPASLQIYLLGGYTGTHTLSDFWVYSVASSEWTLLSDDTEKEKNGPGKRCCHKMVWDEKGGCIYLLGRLGDGAETAAIGGENLSAGPSCESGMPGVAPPVTGHDNGQKTWAYCSEFHRYHTRGLDAGKWDLLSFDTASAGGPQLIFDHQMVMDSEAQMLYVFGGRIVNGDWDDVRYSGLYSYNVRTSKWKLLQPAEDTGSGVFIPPRSGHSMFLDPPTSTLYIFAGQRDDKYFSDMYAYNLRTSVATQVCADFTASGGPDACFTQRAVGDVSEREIYVFCGLTRSQPPTSMTVLKSEAPNWVYRYGTHPGRWTQILSGGGEQRGGRAAAAAAAPSPPAEPQPRYAHQVVYDPVRKMVFLHGGNAGLVAPSGDGDEEDDEDADGDVRMVEGRGDAEKDGGREREKRLDDFWCMTLQRAAPEEVIRKATYRIRRQRFIEMTARESLVEALNYLQTDVSSVVDHDDENESAVFRGLLEHLLTPASLAEDTQPQANGADEPGEDESAGDDASAGSETPKSSSSPPSHLRQTLCAAEDPVERQTGVESESRKTPVLGARYTQRTEVFESLLEFVGNEDKQPQGDLVELVECAQRKSGW